MIGIDMAFGAKTYSETAFNPLGKQQWISGRIRSQTLPIASLYEQPPHWLRNRQSLQRSSRVMHVQEDPSTRTTTEKRGTVFCRSLTCRKVRVSRRA